MLAWLHQTPKDGRVPNGARFDVGLPEVDAESSHLPLILDELGTVKQTGMGIAPLEYVEIESWARSTRLDLLGSEAVALHRMSSAYAGVFNTQDAPCPSDDGSVRESVDLVNIQAMIAMAQSDG